MDIELSTFSAVQQQALFDLLILAIYADKKVSSADDQDLQQLLIAMGHTNEMDRQREFDAAVARILPSTKSVQTAKKLALGLAEAFTDRQQHKQVYAMVQAKLSSDHHVTAWESTLLSELRLKFRV